MSKVWIFLLSLNLAHASWSDLSRKLINKTSKEYQFNGPSGFVSLWGGIQRKFSSFKYYAPNSNFKLKTYFDNEVILYVKNINKKAPLTIYFPGIFGDTNGDLTPIVLNTFEKVSGSHVAVIPNFLSKRYLSFKPKFENGVQTQSINASVKLIKKIIDKIGIKNVSKINLVGESLGTFVAASTMVSLEKNELYKDLKLNLMLLWPPLKVSKVIENFDKQFKKTKKVFDKCDSILNYVLAGFYLYWEKKPISAPKDFVTCMDSFLYHGTFGVSIKKTIKYKAQIYNETSKKDPSSFKEFFQLFSPKLYESILSNYEELNIDYWLKNTSKAKIYLISSKDDFLNQQINWKDILENSNLKQDNLILLNWGGHCGGLALPVWDQVFGKELLN